MWVPGMDKIIEYAASGIGSVAGPMLSSWKARKEVTAKTIEAQGEAEVLAIRAEAQSRALSILVSGQEEARRIVKSDSPSVQMGLSIGRIIEQKVFFQEERRCANIAGVVQESLEYVGDNDVIEHDPDHDWTARFFDYVQDVSSEEMQSLWAQVLAGEVGRPGSTSVRTLGILRDLDQRTAKEFRRLCSLSLSILVRDDRLGDCRVPWLDGCAADNSLEPYGLSFRELNLLNEHGLIISDYESWCDFQPCIGKTVPELGNRVARNPFLYQGRKWVLVARSERAVSTDFRLSGVAFTESGRELAKVVEVEPVTSYDEALRSYFESNGLTMTRLRDS